MGSAVPPRVSLITLGVADIGRARKFYERLGWSGHEAEETVFIQGPAGITDDELVAFASKIIVGPNFTDPDTWPQRPVS